MSNPNDALLELERILPVPPVPVANYVPVRQTGNLLFTAGQTPTRDGILTVRGKLGAEVSIAEGQQASEAAALNCLAAIRQHVGSLQRITAFVSVTGYVACAEGFGDQPQVINGASLLLERYFGDKGRHARAAVGVSELPGGAPVEIAMVVEIHPEM